MTDAEFLDDVADSIRRLGWSAKAKRLLEIASRLESPQDAGVVKARNAASEVIVQNAMRYLVLATSADWCVINETDGMKYSHEELDAAIDAAMEGK